MRLVRYRGTVVIFLTVLRNFSHSNHREIHDTTVWNLFQNTSGGSEVKGPCHDYSHVGFEILKS